MKENSRKFDPKPSIIYEMNLKGTEIDIISYSSHKLWLLLFVGIIFNGSLGYYDHISYLSQDTPIFDTSIRGNMVFDPTISDEELYGILEKVHLKEKVAHLPDQLDTMVGEKGVKLSGGEKQRLAFARIIAQKRNMLILDEPVSALDNITEQSIMETIVNEFRDKTLIIIAHRLNFIKAMDKIIVVEDGSVVGEGTFDYLLAHCDSFKKLWLGGF